MSNVVQWSQGVVPRPVAAAPGSLIAMPVFRLHPRPTESETLSFFNLCRNPSLEILFLSPKDGWELEWPAKVGHSTLVWACPSTPFLQDQPGPPL